MNILVLNGSPRPNGNTVQLVNAFAEGAISKGNKVDIVNICRKRISGCLACEYCHTKGNGSCIQKDDMQEVYVLLKEAEMLVIASPIYYHNISGQLKCALDRFYAIGSVETLPNLKKVSMILCSGDPDMYDGALFSLKGDFEDFLKLQNIGIVTLAGDVTEEKIAEARNLGKSIQEVSL